MSSKNYATPGVYIDEKDAFSRSIIPVATAVPCFVGLTEKAVRGNQSVFETLVKIESLGDYIRYFGSGPLTKFKVEVNEQETISVTPTEKPLYLFNALKLYFANGGGDCYIYAIGEYTERDKINEPNFDKVLKALENEPEPTLIVLPVAHLLSSATEYYNVWRKVLAHCQKMINRFAILDIYNSGDFHDVSNKEKANQLISDFEKGIGTEQLAYGAVYWPWVQATVVQPSDLDIKNINLREIKEALKNNAKDVYPTEKVAEVINYIDQINSDDAVANHNTLLQLSPLYKAIMNKVRDTANILPPSAAMAGIYKYVDNDRGTYQAPANVSVTAVVKPLLTINDADQEKLNIPISGKAVNAIRSFPGKGTLVWGARTMDGNSQDWRYISVRRTVSMIELSVKYAAEAYVFEPNNAHTWSNIQSMISNFLTNMWQGGALAGTTAAEAFSVSVGLGSTMTSIDILDGYMRIMVKVAVTRPAEFIVITFQQQMQTS